MLVVSQALVEVIETECRIEGGWSTPRYRDDSGAACLATTEISVPEGWEWDAEWVAADWEYGPPEALRPEEIDRNATETNQKISFTKFDSPWRLRKWSRPMRPKAMIGLNRQTFESPVFRLDEPAENPEPLRGFICSSTHDHF